MLAGSERDLRFLSPRLARTAKLDLEPAADWAAVLASPAGSALRLAASVDRGFTLDGVTVVAAADLLGGRAGNEATASAANLLPGGGELAGGDVVVHEEFGIGIVEGLETLAASDIGMGGDAVVLRYAKEGRRLVPVAEADRLWRYGADADAVTLDALDGSTWQKRRGDIDAAIAESARALAGLAAEREAIRTDPVIAPVADYERFAAGFPVYRDARPGAGDRRLPDGPGERHADEPPRHRRTSAMARPRSRCAPPPPSRSPGGR